MQHLLAALHRYAHIWRHTAALAPEAGVIGGILGSVTGGVLSMEEHAPKEAVKHMPMGMFLGALTGSITAMTVAIAWPLVLMTSGAYVIARNSRVDKQEIHHNYYDDD